MTYWLIILIVPSIVFAVAYGIMRLWLSIIDYD